MNCKKIAASVSALCIAGGAVGIVSKNIRPNEMNANSLLFGDINGDGTINSIDASILLTYYSYTSTTTDNPALSLQQFMKKESGEEPTNSEISVGTGGDKFTIASWNTETVPQLIAQWKGTDFSTALDDLAEGKIEGIDFVCFGVGGYMASEHYDRMFANGADIDVYLLEPEWGAKYMEDDSRTLDLSRLGFTDDDFADSYSYADVLGKNSRGVRKSVSPAVRPGAFAYRADLAEEYLGVTSSEEMQAAISDFGRFTDAALKIAKKSNGTVSLADSLGGLWQAYSQSNASPLVMDGKFSGESFALGFADMARNLWINGGVSHASQWTDEWLAAGISGDTMGYFVSEWGIDSFLLTACGGIGGSTYGKWSICQGPSPFYWGGYWLAVNPDTDNGKEAHDFIFSSVCDNGNMAEYAIKKPAIVNNMAVMKNIETGNLLYDDSIKDIFYERFDIVDCFMKTAESIDIDGLVTPYDYAARTAIFENVKNYCNYGEITTDGLVEMINESFKEKISD